MLQFRGINPVHDTGYVKQRRGSQLISKNPALMDVQSARPDPYHRRARLNADQLVPLLVEVSQSAAQRLQNIFHAQPLMLPLVDRRVFQVKHHSRRARVEDFHYEVSVICWPWALRDPLLNPLRALQAFADFNQGPPAVFFNGHWFDKANLPPAYLPVLFAVTLPEFYFLAFAAGLARAAAAARRFRPQPPARGFGPQPAAYATVGKLGLLLVAAVVPLAIAILLRSKVYDNTRQFLFVLPPLAALAGCAVAGLLRQPSLAPGLKWPFAALLAVSLGATLLDMVQLHPYEYVFFNRALGGGLPNAATRFDTDYWGLAYRDGAEWVLKNYQASDAQPTSIGNCAYTPFQMSYFLDKSPEASSRFVVVPPTDGPRVFLATTKFMCQQFMAGRTLYVVKRLNTPLLYVIERRRSTAADLRLN